MSTLLLPPWFQWELRLAIKSSFTKHPGDAEVLVDRFANHLHSSMLESAAFEAIGQRISETRAAIAAALATARAPLDVPALMARVVVAMNVQFEASQPVPMPASSQAALQDALATAWERQSEDGLMEELRAFAQAYGVAELVERTEMLQDGDFGTWCEAHLRTVSSATASARLLNRIEVTF